MKNEFIETFSSSLVLLGFTGRTKLWRKKIGDECVQLIHLQKNRFDPLDFHLNVGVVFPSIYKKSKISFWEAHLSKRIHTMINYRDDLYDVFDLTNCIPPELRVDKSKAIVTNDVIPVLDSISSMEEAIELYLARDDQADKRYVGLGFNEEFRDYVSSRNLMN